MDDRETIIEAILRLFRSFPANGKVDRVTLEDYCEAVSRYPGSVVARAVDKFRLGQVERQNKTFVPSIAELSAELRRTGMNEPERKRFFALSGKSQTAIQNQPNVMQLVHDEAKRRSAE